MLTGRPPFQAKTLYDVYQAHISRDADPLNLVRPEVPSELAALVAKMMAKDPDRRFQTPDEVAQALTPFFKKASAVAMSPRPDVTQIGRSKNVVGRKSEDVPEAAPHAVDRENGSVRDVRGDATEEADPCWAKLIDLEDKDTPIGAIAVSRPRGGSVWVWATVGVGMIVMAVMAAWLGVNLKLKTSDGVIVLRNLPEDVEVLVDGNKVSLTWPGGGEPVKIQALPGQRKITIMKGGFTTFSNEVTIKSGESKEIMVKFEPDNPDRPRSAESNASKTDVVASKSSVDDGQTKPGNSSGPHPVDGGNRRIASDTSRDVEPPKASDPVNWLEALNRSNRPALLNAPFEAVAANRAQEEWAAFLGLPVEVANSIGMTMRLIPPGEYDMGSTSKQIRQESVIEPNWSSRAIESEQPRHRVRISQPFYLGKFEVTRDQFAVFVKATNYSSEAERAAERHDWRNPGFEQDADHPVVLMSHNDAESFCNWLSTKGGGKYRLPTEAEWEYACRAGTTTLFSSGDDLEGLVKVGNIRDYSHSVNWSLPKPAIQVGTKATNFDDGFVFTAPVGTFHENQFGLKDMHGNVYEWNHDWYDKSYYSKSEFVDPRGPVEGSGRILRGGGFQSGWEGGHNWSGMRCVVLPSFHNGETGFRVAVSVADLSDSGIFTGNLSGDTRKVDSVRLPGATHESPNRNK